MKTKTLLFVLFAFLFVQISPLQAQLLKKMKERVQAATEDIIAEKAAQKAAQETGKVLDTLLNIDPNSDYSNLDLSNVYMQGGADLDIEPVYSFDTNVLYQMRFDGDKDESVVDYSMWFSDNKNYMATQVKNIQSEKNKNTDMPTSVFSVFDEKNQAMILLMEEQQIGQVVSMEKIKSVSEEQDLMENRQTEFESLKKTGNTKEILGYTCEEFVSENEGTQFSIWVTQELDLYQKNMFFNISRSLGGNSFNQVPSEAKGFLMEMSFANKNTGEKGSMVVKEIRKERRELSTSEVQFVNMSGLMNPK